MKYLTIGTLWKHENDYALDFIRYHRAVGVEHFVIFNNAFTDDNSLEELLKDESDVEVIRFIPDARQLHQVAWGELIKYNQGKTKWLALIDADQCLVPVQTDDVRDILKNYEDFASLQLNWKAFGSSGQDKKLPGSVYERFQYCAPADCDYSLVTQFICQPDRTLPVKVKEPHYPLLPEGELMVNTNKEVISDTKVVAMNPATPLSFNTPALHDVLWVAHYTNKSKEEWLFKNNRGRADIIGEKMPTTQFDEYELQANKVKETRAFELWKKAQIITLSERSADLGYWQAVWESSSAGIGLSSEGLQELEKEVKSLLNAVLGAK